MSLPSPFSIALDDSRWSLSLIEGADLSREEYAVEAAIYRQEYEYAQEMMADRRYQSSLLASQFMRITFSQTFFNAARDIPKIDERAWIGNESLKLCFPDPVGGKEASCANLEELSELFPYAAGLIPLLKSTQSFDMESLIIHICDWKEMPDLTEDFRANLLEIADYIDEDIVFQTLLMRTEIRDELPWDDPGFVQKMTKHQHCWTRRLMPKRIRVQNYFPKLLFSMRLKYKILRNITRSA